jgi:predicted ester cyclase
MINTLFLQSQQNIFAEQQRPLQAKPSQHQQQSNSLEANKLFIESFVQEVFNKHNLSALERYFAPNVIHHNSMAGQGTEGFKLSFRAFFSAFPDVHATIENIISENSVVLVYLNWTGTHKGEFQGIAATNKPISLTSADLFRIGTNGTVVEDWGVVDSFDLLKQIGAFTLNHTNPS